MKTDAENIVKRKQNPHPLTEEEEHENTTGQNHLGRG
jgi:hypothetical protein